MQDPRELYRLVPDAPVLDRPVLIHALSGFIDAGGAAELARAHLLDTLDHRTVATFDVDSLYDYRARRPILLFVEDHWESYADPVLELQEVRDAAGTPFLILAGPEPDVQWERFIAAVRGLVESFGVRLTVGGTAIPMAVPHTRPIGLTAHGTRPELVPDNEPWVRTVQVPASVGNLLEFRLGQAGHDAIGFAVHVPHYLSQIEQPGAAGVLLDAMARATGLVLPTEPLHEAAERARVEVDEQVQRSAEVRGIVRALEQQYDALIRGRGGQQPLDDADLPTADELGAELERFLAEQARREGRGDGSEG